MKRRFTLVTGTAIAALSLLCGAGTAGAAVAGAAGTGHGPAGTGHGPAGTGQGTAGAGQGTAGAAPVQVRVNQVGYTPGSTKVAYAMLPGRAGQVSFTVSGGHGVVFRGRSSADAGAWNSAYHAVYVLDFTGLNRVGSYRITVSAAGQTALSPRFAIAPGSDTLNLYDNGAIGEAELLQAMRSAGGPPVIAPALRARQACLAAGIPFGGVFCSSHTGLDTATVAPVASVTASRAKLSLVVSTGSV
jgi:hypothetical protein